MIGKVNILTLRHFQIFVTVCDEMNMTAAAKVLFMSQPAVSQAISELESHYNVRLFERLSKKLYLTQAGEKLLSYARHINHLNKDTEREMRALNQKGSIRIGASVTIGACVLPKLLAAYQNEYCGSTVSVKEDNTVQIQQLILRDQLDLGLVEGEIILPDMVSKPFAEDQLVLICGKNHPFYERLLIEPHELTKENFILREMGSGTRKTFEEVMSKNALTWISTWTCNNADTIKMAVVEGHGVSVISQRAVCREIESGILHRVNVNGLVFQRQFKLVYHRNKYLTDTMKKFIDYCFRFEYDSKK